MRQVIEILRLKHEHDLSIREIGRSCGLASSTVGDYLLRAEAAGLKWPLPEGVGETELEAQLCAVAPPRIAETPPPPMPDWAHLHAELRRPNVTLRLLWQEYIRTDPSGLKYSRFCERYQEWRKTLEPTLRQVHIPGEKLVVDWAGQTVPIRNGADGTTQSASLFVAALGVSGKIFAEAFPDQKLHSWISAHVHAYQFYGGVTALTVPDNTRTAVVEPCRYEPLLHRPAAPGESWCRLNRSLNWNDLPIPRTIQKWLTFHFRAGILSLRRRCRWQGRRRKAARRQKAEIQETGDRSWEFESGGEKTEDGLAIR